MRFKIALLSVVFLIAFSGCIGQPDVTGFVKGLPDVQAFLAENPDAGIRAIFLDEKNVKSQIEALRERCGPQMQEAPLWYVIIVKGEEKLEVYLDETGKQALCIIKPATEQPPEDECTANTDCSDNNPATKDECKGTPKKCSNTQITACERGDDYCPTGCTNSMDSDCPTTDQCTTNSDCDDGDASTTDSCSGTPKTCRHTIRTCSQQAGHICSSTQTCPQAHIAASDSSRCCPTACETTNPCTGVTCSSDKKCVGGNCVLKTCSERGGSVCSGAQTCSGSTVTVSDSSACCLGSCASDSELDCMAGLGELASEGCDAGCDYCDCTENNGGTTLAKTAADWSKRRCVSDPGRGSNHWHSSELKQCQEGFIGHFYGFQGPCMCGNEYCGISYSGGENMNYCSQGTCSSNESCPLDSECYYNYMKDILNESCDQNEIDLQEGDRHDFSFDGYDYYILIEEIAVDYMSGKIHTHIAGGGDMGLGMSAKAPDESKFRFSNRDHRVGITLKKTYGSLTQNHPNACVTIRKIDVE